MDGNYFLLASTNTRLPMITVPRLSEKTHSKTKIDLFLERENARAFEAFSEVKRKYGYGSPEAKAAWRALTKRTRSL